MQPVDGCTGSEGKQKTNRDGSTLTNFCVFNNLKLTNVIFRFLYFVDRASRRNSG
jgi:hypothetical protein